jgi:mannose-6-phosphate isomerase-like protein (cupin superfamily)
MAIEVVHLQRDKLLHEYGLDTQRIQPWAVLNAPFENSWAVLRVGTASTLHSHHEHEIFIGVRGKAVVECDGRQARFQAGDIAFFKPGLQHRVINDGNEDFEFHSVWWDAAMAERYISRSRVEAQV